MSTVKLGDVAIESRDSLKEKDKSLPLVGLEHLIPEQINLTDWNIGQENTFTKTFEKGDVLFGRRRAYLKKAAVAPCKGICSGDITVIRAKNDKILPELLPFVIQNDIFFDYAVGKSAGSLSPRVKWEHLANYEFNLPELDEQKKLAEVLWQIADTMESYKKLLAKTDEMVKAKFVEMFGSPFDKKVEKYPLKKYANISGGFAFKSEQFISNSIPIIRITNISNGKIDLDYLVCYPEDFYSNNIEYQIHFGDILMAMSGATTGKAGIYTLNEPALINQRVAKIREIENISNKYFLYGLTQMDWFYNAIQETASGGAQPNISISQIENIQIPKAPIELQNNFAEIILKSEESKATIQASLDSLSAVYKKIIVENLGGSN